MDPKAPHADCNSCTLRDQPFVPGYGPRQACRVIVGEAPGKEEVRLGRPFVGKSGERLDEALAANEVDRSRVYVTNAVLCRPPGNREPSSAEIDACRDRLVHEIQGTKPRKVLALGRSAREALTGDKKTPIKEMRECRPARHPDLGDSEVRVTWHPAAHLATNERMTWTGDIGWLRECEVERAGRSSDSRLSLEDPP
jgi:uracil-DNA glycosylase family 4